MKEITKIKLAKEKKDFKDKLHLVEKNTLAGFLTVDFSKYLVFPFSHKFAVFTIGQTPNWYLIVAISWAIIGFPAIYAVYKGKKFLISASPNSTLTLANAKAAPLHEGFTIQWLADTTKDPEGKARISFEVK